MPAGNKPGNNHRQGVKNLTEKDRYARKVAKAIMSEKPMSQAAKDNNVTTMTIYNYLKDPDLKALVEHYRRQNYDKTIKVGKLSLTTIKTSIKKVESYLSDIKDNNISPENYDDLLKGLQTLAGTLKIINDTGIEDSLGNITKEERISAAASITKGVMAGIKYALLNPSDAADTFDRLTIQLLKLGINPVPPPVGGGEEESECTPKGYLVSASE